MPDPAKFAEEFPAAAARVFGGGPVLVLRCVHHPEQPMGQPGGVSSSLLACPAEGCAIRVMVTFEATDRAEQLWPNPA